MSAIQTTESIQVSKQHLQNQIFIKNKCAVIKIHFGGKTSLSNCPKECHLKTTKSFQLFKQHLQNQIFITKNPQLTKSISEEKLVSPTVQRSVI
jgi:hypothetical protein